MGRGHGGRGRPRYGGGRNRIRRGPGHITALECEGEGARYFCQVSYTGGAPKISIRWSQNGVGMPLYDNRQIITPAACRTHR